MTINVRLQCMLMAEELSRTAQRTHIFFVKQCSALYRPVAGNVIREVANYIGTCFLPILSLGPRKAATLLNLSTNGKSAVQLTEEVSIGATYCSVDEFTLFCITTKDRLSIVQSVHLLTGKVTREAGAARPHCWAGLICYQSKVIVFGGTDGGRVVTFCEAFSLHAKQWTEYPEMHTGKFAFTPVEHRGDVYLPAPVPEEQQLEVFTPATLQYRLLPLKLQQKEFGSVSFLHDEMIVTVTVSREVFAWRLGSEEKQHRNIGIINEHDSGISSGPTIRFGMFEYWVGILGKIVKFDLERKVTIVIDSNPTEKLHPD